jgi:2-phospho-L-lactate guanylyltransferase
VTYVVIPAKGFNGAKQRLATFLRPHERARLAQAMLTDTLTACCGAQGLIGVGVVTCDREVAKVVESLGAEVLWEPQAQGHRQAVAFGVHVCTQRGVASMLTMPADVPLLTAADVETIARVPTPPVPVVLVPNRDDLGTNALRLSPPHCLPFAFGHDSFRHHLRLAAEHHLAVAVRRLPRLALDIDAPEDLALFAALQTPGHSLQVLTELGIVERLHTIAVPPTYENIL